MATRDHSVRRAIVLNSFGRGGSNIVANIIGSSPNVLLSPAEFWQFYYGLINLPPKIYRRLGVFPGRLISTAMFSGARFRRRFDERMREAIDTDYQLLNVRGLSPDRITHALFKVTEYDVFLNDRIEEQFDEVYFVGLVRSGYGLCESWKRRGMPARMAGRSYCQIAGEMIRQAASRPNYSLMRFEDLLFDPITFLRHLYALLPIEQPDDDSYIHRSKGFGPGHELAAAKERRMEVISLDRWAELVSKDIHGSAIDRLTAQDLRDFDAEAIDVMRQLYPE